MAARVKFSDSTLKVAELFDSLPVEPVLRTFVQYLIGLCSQQEAASDVIRSRYMMLIVPEECVKFRDKCLNRSREIQPKAVGVAFSAVFRTPITAERKQLVMSYPVWLFITSEWMFT